MAILKGLKRLKRVAFISILATVVTLIITIPFFYYWGMWGVVPALVFSAAAVMAAHLAVSLPVYPWRVDLFSRRCFREGWGMVKMGMFYTMAMTITPAVCMGLSFFISSTGSLADVGLYSIGHNLVIVYAGVIFTAIEADYFPRLSGVHMYPDRMNNVINQQVKVCILLMSPFLVLFMLAMPLVIWLLYSSEFFPMTDMAVCASLHMFFKAMTLPVAYTSLAKGDSLIFFWVNLIYDLVMASLVAAGYLYAGILGCGIALALAGVFDWVLIYKVYGRRYGFRFASTSKRFTVIQFVCVFTTLVVCLQPYLWLRYTLGGICLICSLGISIQILRHELTLFSALKEKFLYKVRRTPR